MIVHNPTTNNIRDYPIQNPQTKEVKLWSIDSGETLEFPDFVGEYLLQVYGFLQRIVTEEQLKKEQEEKKRVDAGMKFSQVKVVKSTPIDTKPPDKPKGFTNAGVRTPAGQPLPAATTPPDPNAPPPPPPNPRPIGGQTRVVPTVEVSGTQGIACADEKCTERFETDEAMRAHYGVKHLQFDKPTAT